jgi:hypothetical protein
VTRTERERARNLAAGYGNDRPELVHATCDGCSQQALCIYDYGCPAWCGGYCGTDGCVAVMVFCWACMPRRFWDALWANAFPELAGVAR